MQCGIHLISRQDGAVRAKLYRLIGFEPTGPIELPSSLAPRRITNPDAPLIDCTIDLVGSDGKTYTSAPILYASVNDYDPAGGKTLFQHLTYRLLVVDNAWTDGSADMVTARFPWVTLIRSARNGGFAYGNNRGITPAPECALLWKWKIVWVSK